MNRQDAEGIITEYLKPVFGFALKRCKNIHDAEDLSQEIVMKAFRALLARDDIGDAGRFIWTVAHNALSNYYRDAAKGMTGVSLDEVAEVLADRGLRLGQTTVKWHLFEAKKELKRGMDTMRKSGELKFNPIRFHSISFEEVATIRPDGGHNIVTAAVVPDNLVLPEDYIYMNNWSGPMWNWNEDSEHILWQIDSEWSDRETPGGALFRESQKGSFALCKRGAGASVQRQICMVGRTGLCENQRRL